MRALKTMTIIATFIFISSSMLVAQIDIGIRTGIAFNNNNISGIVGDILPDTRTHIGYSIGVYSDIPMNSSFSFHPEIAYSSKGFSMNQGTKFDLLGIDIPVGVRAETNMKYIETLALMRYKIGAGPVSLFVEAGPGLGYATSAYIQPKATLFLEFNLPQIEIDLGNEMYSRMDITANIGTGLEYEIGPGVIGANIRYSHGLSNVLNDPLINTRLTHQSINLGVSYGYKF